MANPIKIGVGGPVGAGKTQLIEKLVRRLSKDMSIGVNKRYLQRRPKILVNTGVYQKIELSVWKRVAVHIQHS